ncbi:hypothetical protein Tco_0198551 [Tanacetum coccineum]
MVERQRGDEGNVGVEMKVVFEDGDGDGVERVTVVSAVVMRWSGGGGVRDGSQGGSEWWHDGDGGGAWRMMVMIKMVAVEMG